ASWSHSRCSWESSRTIRDDDRKSACASFDPVADVARGKPNEPTGSLVTGGNRGIGLEVCRQLARRGHTVLLGSRGEANGHDAARDIARDGLTGTACPLHVTDPDSIERVRSRVETEFGRLDVLVNNAAVLYDTWQHAVDADVARVREALAQH